MNPSSYRLLHFPALISRSEMLVAVPLDLQVNRHKINSTCGPQQAISQQDQRTARTLELTENKTLFISVYQRALTWLCSTERLRDTPLGLLYSFM